MSPGHWRAMTLRNGLYSIHTSMTDGGRGFANGVIVLRDGTMAGGDSHFYWTGTYTCANGRWRGDLVTNEHTRSVGELPLFGGREVTSGFSGSYVGDEAVATGMSLVGKTSVLFEARLKFRCEV
jgi:T3SS negative regulator,GrlR